MKKLFLLQLMIFYIFRGMPRILSLTFNPVNVSKKPKIVAVCMLVSALVALFFVYVLITGDIHVIDNGPMSTRKYPRGFST